MAFQEVHGGVHILDDRDIPQSSPSRGTIIRAVRAVTVVQDRGYPDVSGCGDALRHLLDELIDSSLVLYDHDCGKRALPVRDAHIQLHILTVDLDALPKGCHGAALLR
jgi:hypothetical protein